MWNQRDSKHEIEASDQIPHPLWVVIKFPTPGKTKLIKCPPSLAGKDVKWLRYAQGGGGMFKLRFDWYISAMNGWRHVLFWGGFFLLGRCLYNNKIIITHLFTALTYEISSWIPQEIPFLVMPMYYSVFIVTCINSLCLSPISTTYLNKSKASAEYYFHHVHYFYEIKPMH